MNFLADRVVLRYGRRFLLNGSYFCKAIDKLCKAASRHMTIQSQSFTSATAGTFKIYLFSPTPSKIFPQISYTGGLFLNRTFLLEQKTFYSVKFSPFIEALIIGPVWWMTSTGRLPNAKVASKMKSTFPYPQNKTHSSDRSTRKFRHGRIGPTSEHNKETSVLLHSKRLVP